MSNVLATGAAGSTSHAPGAGPIRVLAFMEATTLTGPAKNLLEFARRARNSPDGAVLSVATFSRGNKTQGNAFIDRCRESGIDVHIIRERFLGDPSLVSSVSQLVRSVNPDIVQTHMVKSHFLFRLSGEHTERTWIAFHHGYTWTTLKTRSYNQLNRFSLRKADKVVTVCAAFAENIHASCGVPTSKIVVRHNAVKSFVKSSQADIDELRSRIGIPKYCCVFVMIGRLSREKAQRDGIEAFVAFARIHKENNPHLVIVGDGPEKSELYRMCTQAGISAQVHFVGQESNVAPYYSLADIALLPSHTEGSPNALLEAMAAGVPTVATAVGGVPEIAEQRRSALLVPPREPMAICEAMQELVSNSELRASIASSATIRAAQFSEEEYCNAMLGLYRECLSAGESS